MSKKYRRLQRISAIPILAALLLASNPAAVGGRQRVDDISQTDTTTDVSMDTVDVSDNRLRNK